MIYANIRIHILDPHNQPAPRCWRAIADAGEDLAKLATQQHDTTTAPPLEYRASGTTRDGDTWEVEVRAGPF